MALGSTQPLAEINTRNLPGNKKLSAFSADNLVAICEQNVWKCGASTSHDPKVFLCSYTVNETTDTVRYEYSQNYVTEFYNIDNNFQQLISNIIKKKTPNHQNTSKYDKTTRGLSVVQWIHTAYLACISYNKNKDEN
jgi:hypothetical protein